MGYEDSMHRTLRGWLLALAGPLLVAAIPHTPPPPLALTADEESTLSEGKIVVRVDPGSETGGGVTGVLDVSAAPDVALDALLDLQARVGEVGGLRSVTRYLDAPEQIGVRWELRVLTFDVVFHNLYTIDRARGWVRYSLDPSKDNALASVEGAYQVYPVPAGTRIVYRTETDSGRRIPQWLKRKIATDSLEEQLSAIGKRAEATP